MSTWRDVQPRYDRDSANLEKNRQRVRARSISPPGPVGSGQPSLPGPHGAHALVILGLVLALVASVEVIVHLTSDGRSGPAASAADDPAPKIPHTGSLGQRIAAIAESQLGYSTDPSDTYCNEYSAYFDAGAADCGNSNLDEEWCADFAAWVWLKSGALVTYQFVNGDINSSAASFYEWGVRHGTWHPVGSGYVPRPGDVAVYGLDMGTLVASHVAVVTGYRHGEHGPDVVNGDGDKTGFSRVEIGMNQYEADAPGSPAYLSGYTSPTPAG